jgi:hypothetical protein
MVENINSDIAASVIDISAFRRFVVRPTAILFFWNSSLLFQDDHESIFTHELNTNNFIWVDALTKLKSSTGQTRILVP